MRIYLEVASQVLVLIFVLSTLFSVGLLVSARQVLAALQQRRSLAVALCANFVVLPGAALALCWGLQLAPPMQAALLLVATAPGSPVLLRLNEFARGDQARAVGLLVLLTSLTVVYQPLVLPMLLPGLSVSPMPIARALVLTVLLPLVLGLLLKARWPALAGRLRPALARLGNISAALSCFILLPLVYLDALKDVVLNGGGLLVLLLYLPLAVGAGWWLGGPDADQRRLLALCCGQGSMGAAFVIAAHNFNNPHVIAMLLLILWASLALLIPLALVFRRQYFGRCGRAHPKRRFNGGGYVVTLVQVTGDLAFLDANDNIVAFETGRPGCSAILPIASSMASSRKTSRRSTDLTPVQIASGSRSRVSTARCARLRLRLQRAPRASRPVAAAPRPGITPK